MKLINISTEACDELKDFLKENDINDFKIRINFAGNACSGPIFNITVDDPTEEDYVETISDITFMAEKSLTDEFGGFIILSSEENDGRGLSLRPVIEQEGGCSTCHGCH